VKIPLQWFRSFVLLVALATSASATEPTPYDSKRMSCGDCLKAGLAAKENGCPMCLPPVLGIRDTSCSKWTADHREHGTPAGNDDFWLFGVFSGYNIYAPGTAKNPKELLPYYEEPNLIAYVNSKCHDSPEKSVIEIVVAFTNGIQRAKEEAAARIVHPKVRFAFHVLPSDLPTLHDLLKVFAEQEHLTFDYSVIKIPPEQERSEVFVSLVKADGVYIAFSNLKAEDHMIVECYPRGSGAHFDKIVESLETRIRVKWPDVRAEPE